MMCYELKTPESKPHHTETPLASITIYKGEISSRLVMAYKKFSTPKVRGRKYKISGTVVRQIMLWSITQGFISAKRRESLTASQKRSRNQVPGKIHAAHIISSSLRPENENKITIWDSKHKTFRTLASAILDKGSSRSSLLNKLQSSDANINFFLLCEFPLLLIVRRHLLCSGISLNFKTVESAKGEFRIDHSVQVDFIKRDTILLTLKFNLLDGFAVKRPSYFGVNRWIKSILIELEKQQIIKKTWPKIIKLNTDLDCISATLSTHLTDHSESNAAGITNKGSEIAKTKLKTHGLFSTPSIKPADQPKTDLDNGAKNPATKAPNGIMLYAIPPAAQAPQPLDTTDHIPTAYH